MPFIQDKSGQLRTEKAIGIDELGPEFDQFSFQEKVTAAYRLENTFGSFLAQEPDLPDSVVSNTEFDLWGSLTDEEKIDEKFLSNVATADNITEVDATRRQRNREKKDREILQQGGFFPTAIASLADPINLIPVGGTAYRTYRTGGSILRNGMATSAVAVGSTAVTEATLHQTQLTRTWGESAANMTAAAFLGGILGSTPVAIKQMMGRAKVDEPTLHGEIDRTMNPEQRIADGNLSTLDINVPRSVGAAEALSDPQVRGKLAKAATKLLAIDPLSRTITSDRRATRRVSSELAENPLDMDQPLRTSVESFIKAHDGKFFEAIEGHEKHFIEYQKAGGNFKRKVFNEEVGKAVRNGSNDVNIQAAADSWKSKLYEPLKKEFIENGLLPKDVDVSTAENYLNRIWNKQKIAADLGGFIDKTKLWLDEQNAEKLSIQGDVERLSTVMMENQTKSRSLGRQLDTKRQQIIKAEKQLEEVRRAEKAVIERAFKTKEAGKRAKVKIGVEGRRGELGIAEGRQRNRANKIQDNLSGLRNAAEDLEARINKLDDSAIESVNGLENAIQNWPGKAASKVRAQIRGRDGVAAEKASRELIKTISKLNKIDLDVVDTEELAGEIAGRIMGTPDGMLPYSYKIGENSSGGISDKLAGPFKNRSFLIPDELMENYLENNIELLGARYLKSTAPDLELMKRFGDVEMKSQLKDIEDEWIPLIKAEKDPKKAIKLEKQKDKEIKDVAAMRDRMRGRFGQVDHDNPWVRAGRVARDLNYMRLLGGVVAASVPDVARIVAAEGITRTFSTGLVPLVSNLKAFKMAAREAKLYGVGTDALMGGRAEIMADVADYAAGGTAFERAVRSAATKFSSVNLMNQWTGGIKQLHAVVTQTRLIEELKAGKYDKRLDQLGISEADAQNIAIEMRKHSKKIDGVQIANSKDWANQELAMMWGAALRKESDRVIIVPGQEKPLFMSTELGKTIFQFKTFMFSATQRVLISNLQAQDKHYIQGMLGLVGVGMMSYAFKQWDAGRPLSDDPAVWVAEGVDRSGMMGYLMEANNTLEKISGNHYGFRPLLGINQSASRYASRTALDSALGPTFGLAGEIVKIAGAATGEREWKDSDSRAIRRLLPGQNLSIIRQGLDEVEKAIR